jgi:hypothetical protein
MFQKLVRRKQPRIHPRAADSPQHPDWRRSVSAGMQRAKLNRQKEGYLTFTEYAVKKNLPVSTVKRMADTGGLPIVSFEGTSRRYVDVKRRDAAA